MIERSVMLSANSVSYFSAVNLFGHIIKYQAEALLEIHPAGLLIPLLPRLNFIKVFII